MLNLKSVQAIQTGSPNLQYGHSAYISPSGSTLYYQDASTSGGGVVYASLMSWCPSYEYGSKDKTGYHEQAEKLNSTRYRIPSSPLYTIIS